MIEELGPEINYNRALTTYNVSDGSARQSSLFAKPSGPFGLYSYRIQACYESSCSDFSPYYDWEVSERAVDAPTLPTAFEDLAASVTNVPNSSVGTTAGEFRVDETGQANYSVPIMTAPASGGVAPQISLDYNSGGGNGPLGVGWNIGGLSAIGRCGQTYEQDNGQPNSGVQITATDRLCLDGQRLIQLHTGDYWAANGEYRTEIESFSKISWQTANGLTYLEVRRKDGSISTYGATVDARVVTPDAEVFTWAMSRFQDSAGNYIDFIYEQLPGDLVEHRIKEIHYTGNLSGAPIEPLNKLLFGYEPRVDKTTGWIAAVGFQSTQRLRSVESWGVLDQQQEENQPSDYQPAPLRSYELGYALDSYARSTLQSIQECNKPLAPGTTGRVCYAPTQFAWNGVSANLTLNALNGIQLDQTVDALPNNMERLRIADLDGDGREDLIYTRRGDDNLYATFGSGQTVAGKVEAFDKATTQTILTNLPHDKDDWHLADLNGDGRQDVVHSSTAPTDDHFWYLSLSQGRSALAGAVKLATIAPWQDPFNNNALTRKRIVEIVDQNGDGRVDLLLTDGLQGAAFVAENTFSSTNPNFFGALNAIVLNGGFFSRLEQTFGDDIIISTSRTPTGAFDFDGNGSADSMTRVVVKCYVLNDQCTTEQSTATLVDLYVGYHVTRKLGTQFATDEEPSLTQEYRNPDMSLRTAILGECIGNCVDFSDIRMVDLNGDGLADATYRKRGPVDVADESLYYRINLGGAFASESAIQNLKNLRYAQILDYDGNGLPDLLYPDGATWKALLSRNGVFNVTASTLAATGDFDADPQTGESPDTGVFLDINGDGLKDYIFLPFDEGNLGVEQTSFGRNDALNATSDKATMRAITDGFGATTTLSYRPLTDSDVYTRGTSLTELQGFSGSAVFDITGPMYVLSEARSSAPTATAPGVVVTDTTSAVQYRYAKARIQAGGRGFLGFAWVESEELQTGVRTRTFYHQDFPFTGLPQGTTQYAPNGDQVSSATSTWASQTTHPGVYFNYIASSEERSYELNTTSPTSRIVTANEYTEAPQYGNLSKITVTTYDGESTLVQTQVTDNDYDNDTIKWHLARLRQADVTTTRPGLPTVRRRSKFEYVSSTGLLNLEKAAEVDSVWQETGRWRATAYAHDRFGNRTATILTGSDIALRTTSEGYDDLGRYTEVAINAYGQVVSRAMGRDQWGNLLESRDMLAAAEGKESSTYQRYDLMGRPYLQYHRSGAWTRTQLQLGATGCPAGTAYRRVSDGADGAHGYTCFDILGRETRSASRAYNLNLVYVDTGYDAFGRARYRSEPYYNGQSAYWAETEYDELGRPSAVIQPNDLRTEFSYQGLITDTEHYVLVNGSYVLDTARREQRNALGELLQVQDNRAQAFSAAGVAPPSTDEQTTTVYAYDAVGNLTLVDGPIAADNMAVSYDTFGNRQQLIDPDAGVSTYYHDVLGQLVCEVNAAQQATHYTYDLLGRKLQETFRAGVTTANTSCPTTGTEISHSTWTYDTNSAFSASMGSLVSEVAPDMNRNFSYDRLGRPIEIRTFIAGQPSLLYESTVYDEYGRVFQTFDASDEGVRYVYSGSYLQRTCNARGASQQALYEYIQAYDARGNPTQVGYYGESCFGTQTLYDSLRGYAPDTGLLTTILTDSGAIQNLEYLYDDYGNLVNRIDRKDPQYPQEEDFEYDKLQRLIRIVQDIATPTGTVIHTDLIAYDPGGNITNKDLRDYTYGNLESGCTQTPGPHAVTRAGNTTYCYDAKGNQVSDSSGRTSAYNVYNKPTSIANNGQTVAFQYGPNRQRFKKNDAGTETVYVGNVEITTDGSRLYRRYVGSLLIQHVQSVGNPGFDSTTIRYTHGDHIGSADAIVRIDVDGLGGHIRVRESWLSFDAFGKRRSAIPWSDQAPTDIATILGATNRGFTGHEMLDDYGLIHMNGRIYDPVLGRFLSPDPVVQEPGNGQNLNRYTYVLNNPLSFTDPSGYSFERYFRIAFVALVSYLTYGLASNLAWTLMPSVTAGVATTAAYTSSAVIGSAVAGFVGGAISTGTLKGALRGAFTSGVYAYIGHQISTGIQNWQNDRGSVWRIRRDKVSDEIIKTRIDKPELIQINDLFINGQANKLEKAAELGFEHLGGPEEYVLFHNPSHGFIADTTESVLGKLTNTSSLSRQLARTLEGQADSLVRVTAHSQGGIITSNALRQVAKNVLTTNTVVDFHGAAVGRGVFSRTISSAGAKEGIYQAHFFDAVPNLIGLATKNPLRVVGSIVASPLLFFGGQRFSPHTVYRPVQ